MLLEANAATARGHIRLLRMDRLEHVLQPCAETALFAFGGTEVGAENRTEQLAACRFLPFGNDIRSSSVWAAQHIIEAFPDDSAPRFMVRDRDGIYSEHFVRRVKAMYIEELFRNLERLASVFYDVCFEALHKADDCFLLRGRDLEFIQRRLDM